MTWAPYNHGDGAVDDLFAEWESERLDLLRFRDLGIGLPSDPSQPNCHDPAVQRPRLALLWLPPRRGLKRRASTTRIVGRVKRPFKNASSGIW